MVSIIQGEDKEIFVRVTDSNGDPLDITNHSEITACFLNADNTLLSLSLGLGIDKETPFAIGKIKITITAAQSLLLAEVKNTTLELALTNAGLINKVQIKSAYSVIAKVC